MKEDIPINNIEAGRKDSLNEKEKNDISQLWTELVVDCEKAPENLSGFSNAELKEWLFQSLMHDIKRFLVEWGIETDEARIREIVMEEDREKKAELEKKYILDMHAEVTEKIKKFPDKGESRRWDSWPKMMREMGSFNCVGASIIGVEILENAGIESYKGMPANHAINLAKLSNGEWWYIDFLNGSSQCKKIEPKEISIDGVRTLEINDADIEYNLVPYEDNSESVAPILGNLTAMQYEAADGTIDDKNRGKIAAQKYLEKYGKKIPGSEEMENIQKVLFPFRDKLNRSKVFQEERARIHKLHESNMKSRDYLNLLSEEEEKGLLNEIGRNSESVRKLFVDGDKGIYETVSEVADEFLHIMHRELEDLKEKDEEEYGNRLGRILEILERMRK